MLRKQASRRKQAGFTLVEIAIVLVIIGLLLGGVLKGQELINSAKVKNMINDFRSVSTFVYSYQDRFRALPGDDGAASTHVNGGVNATTHATGGANGDGRINGNWDSTTATEESYLFWNHVRLAGLAAGNPTVSATDYNYTNADGGRVGITGQNPNTTAGNNFSGSFYVCSAGIQGRYARQIDSTIDDGNTSTGTVRVIGTNAGGQVSTGPQYQVVATDDATLFTVCVAY